MLKVVIRFIRSPTLQHSIRAPACITKMPTKLKCIVKAQSGKKISGTRKSLFGKANSYAFAISLFKDSKKLSQIFGDPLDTKESPYMGLKSQLKENFYN